MVASALFGQPPANMDDYWTVKYIYESAGIPHFNASKGIAIPPLRPPPSEYHFQTKGPGIIAGLSICIIVMTAVTALRLYVRLKNNMTKPGIDDVLIVPGVLLSIAYPALQIAMVVYGGAGKHMYDVTYHEYYLFHWLSAVAQLDFFIAVGVIKMSITAFNMRLSAIWNKKWRYVHWAFFALLGAYTIIAAFLNIFQCNPAVASYDTVKAGKLPDGFKCMSLVQLGTILRVVNITMDYLLLTTPIIILWRVQMDWRRKARLFVVFSFGALACVGSVMTLVAKDHLKSDTFYNYTSLLTWTLVEITLSVITASLPIVSSLIPDRYIFGSSSSKSKETHQRCSRSFGSQSPDRGRSAKKSWFASTLGSSTLAGSDNQSMCKSQADTDHSEERARSGKSVDTAGGFTFWEDSSTEKHPGKKLGESSTDEQLYHGV